MEQQYANPASSSQSSDRLRGKMKIRPVSQSEGGGEDNGVEETEPPSTPVRGAVWRKG